MPEIYVEQKKAHDEALANSRPIIEKAWGELAKLTGRKYSPIETYKVEGADTLILGMGSICETASLAVDQLRESGKKVGLVKVRLWRPLPVDDLRKILSAAKDVVVLDRSVALGGASAPVTAEIRALMYHEPQRPKIHCMMAGIGGRDVTPKDVSNMVQLALSETDYDYHFYGVRG
jgi:pyruvate ferredoxin oxidoreductase alpha subunit